VELTQPVDPFISFRRRLDFESNPISNRSVFELPDNINTPGTDPTGWINMEFSMDAVSIWYMSFQLSS